MLSLTLASALFIIENIFSIREQASYTRFRPVPVGLPTSQIHRDIQVGEIRADFYTGFGGPRRPLLIFLHGGFFQGGNKKNYAYLGGLGVRLGYVVAIPEILPYPGMVTTLFYSAEEKKRRALPAQAERLVHFIADLGTLAERFHFDIKRLHIAAHASGSLLVGALDPTQIKSLTLISPILSLEQFLAKARLGQNVPELRAISGYTSEAEIARLAPERWLAQTEMPVFLICAERDLPAIQESCRDTPLARKKAPSIQRTIAAASHFELLFHLGSKVEPATDPLKRFWLENAQR